MQRRIRGEQEERGEEGAEEDKRRTGGEGGGEMGGGEKRGVTGREGGKEGGSKERRRKGGRDWRVGGRNSDTRMVPEPSSSTHPLMIFLTVSRSLRVSGSERMAGCEWEIIDG